MGSSDGISMKPIVLHIGDSIKHNHKLYEEFATTFNGIRASTAERERPQFLEALKEGRWGSFSAIFRPYWNTGGEMGQWNEELVSLLPKFVRVFASAGAGYDWADTPLLAKRKAWCFVGSRCGHGNLPYLVRFRNLTWTHLAARSCDVDQFLDAHANATATAHNPRGHSLGIIGLGNIGSLIARKAYLAFGMKINYFDVLRKPEAQEAELGATFVENLDDLLGSCDCILIATPGVGGKKFIDKESLQKLKPGARLVNIARGSLVDEEAVADAIESGRLFAAGLDVHEFEPKVNPRLAKLRQVTLTCHNAGGAIETNYGLEAMAMQNITAVLIGKDPLTAVNQHLIVPK